VTAEGRLLVVWNPNAGGGQDGDRPKRRQAIVQALAQHGLDAEIFESASESMAKERVEAALEEGPVAIVAAGGDATVGSIAAMLVDRKTPLGILPLGTAMNVARSLDIPFDLPAAAGILATGEVRAMDVGQVRDHTFLGIASIGLEAEMLAAATHVHDGRLHGAFDILRRAWRSPRTRVRLQLDGREVRARAVSLAVANSSYTGHGLELVPSACLDDGRFDLLLFESVGRAQLAGHLLRTLLGRPPDPRIRRYRARTVRVSTHRPLPVRADSIDLGETPIELVTRPGALQVIAPATTARRAEPTG
jgi:diacylglycerol kinase (ATP)